LSMTPTAESVSETVQRALAEDLGDSGDLTARLTLPAGVRGAATIVAREAGILAGVGVAHECFRQLDATVEFGVDDLDDLDDGAELVPGRTVLTIRGDSAAILAAERTALNFMQRLSGIATKTRAFVDAVAGLPVRIMDTRKTTPNLRALEKAAVRVGGGTNHRVGLFDQVLLKENHFAMAGRPYEDVVRAAATAVNGPVIAEAQTATEAVAAVAGGAGVVLLDNFEPGSELVAAVRAIRSRVQRMGGAVEIEASGGVTLANVRAFAECGVDRISIGALTHSVAALDLSLLSKNTA
jgi:nicotinate-nucleotide pyrophosphorylase (carboxylating)